MASGGALNALAALGPQNLYTNADPLITFFKGGYKRHTNFQIAEMTQSFEGGSDLDHSNTKTAHIERNGDLLAYMYLYMHFTANVYLSGSSNVLNYDPDPTTAQHTYLTNSVGHAAINTVTFDIGGARVQEHTGEYMEVCESLYADPAKRLTETIGYSETLEGLINYSRQEQHLYVPLRFYFLKALDHALPLIALQHHKATLKLTNRTIDQLIIRRGAYATTPLATETTCDLLNVLVSYVYLDSMERRLFAQRQHEYLIEQVQLHTATHSSESTQRERIIFNHPVKELIWAMRSQDNLDALDYFNFAGVDETFSVGDPLQRDPYLTVRLRLNGQDRTLDLPAQYYRNIQPLQAHDRIPNRFVYCYSFATDPESLKPTGSVNFSRIDNPELLFTFDSATAAQWDGDIFIWAVSMNVAKILSGMFSLNRSTLPSPLLFFFIHITNPKLLILHAIGTGSCSQVADRSLSSPSPSWFLFRC